MKKNLYVLLKGMLFFFSFAIIGSILPTIPSNNAAIWRFGAELVPFLLIISITLIFCIIDRKTIHIFNNIFFNICIGIGVGLIWLLIPTLILILTGTMKILKVNYVPSLWLWIISAFLNVIMQELLIRGYLYQLIKENYNVITSTIITTTLFTLMHGGVLTYGIIPILNIITMSLFMTAILEYTNSLVTPIIIHSIWNIVGSIILGSIIVLIVNVLLFIIFTELTRKKLKIFN
ncbi:MAG: CPBP family intramembrane glutamic endopeptidase [Clostridium perfringens]|nr:CPBP family intramembrane glutamic endopeptidase [Clostridium perfringens]